MESIYLGAGCFWCIESIFLNVKGVQKVESGYMGGHIKNPCYREVCEGTTGHAEVVLVEYDPQIISLDILLQIFWSTHDPTTLNRQGADRGTQYRSAIYYTIPEHLQVILESKDRVGTSIWSDPIVTEIAEASTFYKAEDYHQNYFDLNQNQSYCTIVINPKVQKFKKSFSTYLK